MVEHGQIPGWPSKDILCTPYEIRYGWGCGMVASFLRHIDPRQLPPLALLILKVVAAKSSTPSMKAACRTYIFRPAEWRCRWKQLQKLVNQPCIWESEWPDLFWLDISSSGLEWMTIDVHWCTFVSSASTKPLKSLQTCYFWLKWSRRKICEDCMPTILTCCHRFPCFMAPECSRSSKFQMLRQHINNEN